MARPGRRNSEPACYKTIAIKMLLLRRRFMDQVVPGAFFGKTVFLIQPGFADHHRILSSCEYNLRLIRKPVQYNTLLKVFASRCACSSFVEWNPPAWRLSEMRFF
jgi:hypothetical protein